MLPEATFSFFLENYVRIRVGNVVLIVGALMSHQNHPRGLKTVRVISYLVIGSTALESAITYFAVTGADAWPTLDAPTKGTLIGGLVGGTIGAFLQWGLILFLFSRNHGGNTPEPKKSANDSKQSLFYQAKQAGFSESKPNVAPLDLQKADASHKCPNCSVVFKLGANLSPNAFVTCPVCIKAFSPSAATFVG